MKRRLSIIVPVAALGLTLSSIRPASAHFLWAEVKNDAKGGAAPTFRVTFGEAPEEPINGVPAERLKDAHAWTSDKTALALGEKDGFYTATLPTNSGVAGVAQTWGVLDKTAEGRGVFLLEYYAKAAVSPDAAMQNTNLPMEVFLRRDGADWVAQTRYNGQTVKDAKFVFYTPGGDEAGKELTTDANGEVRLAPAAPGLYALRAFVAETKAGTLDGKAYPTIRSYSTLTFPIENVAATTQAVIATLVTMGNPQANPIAYSLLKAAHDARQSLPQDFPGFTAKVAFDDGMKTHEGTVKFTRTGSAQVTIEGPAPDDKAWLIEEMQSNLDHRRGGDFSKGDGSRALSLGKDENSFGTLINVNDRMQSSYRVKDNKILEVTRVGGGSRFTVSVIQTMSTDAGKFLSTHFIVTYRDEKTGALQKVQAFRDKFSQIGTAFLPIERVVLSIEPNKATPRERSIKLRDIQLLPSEPRVALAETGGTNP